MNVCISKYRNSIHVSFSNSTAILQEHSALVRKELLISMLNPSCNIFINFKHINFIDTDVVDALVDCSRLAKMNNGQITVYNVNNKVYSVLKDKNVEHLFFWCDMSKKISLVG